MLRAATLSDRRCGARIGYQNLTSIRFASFRRLRGGHRLVATSNCGSDVHMVLFARVKLCMRVVIGGVVVVIVVLVLWWWWCCCCGDADGSGRGGRGRGGGCGVG